MPEARRGAPRVAAAAERRIEMLATPGHGVARCPRSCDKVGAARKKGNHDVVDLSGQDRVTLAVYRVMHLPASVRMSATENLGNVLEHHFV
jgi:hypothetical protein